MWKRKGILLVVLCVLLCVSAFAQNTIDMDAKGSISVVLSVDGKPVSGGEVTIYRVGEIYNVKDGVYSFGYIDDFKGCNQPLGVDLLDHSVAQKIWNYAMKENINGIDNLVNNQGKALFEGLKVGLYLVCQTEEQAADGYYPFKPFLLSVPFKLENGELIYDVDAGPKCRVESPEPSPSPSPSPTPPGVSPSPSPSPTPPVESPSPSPTPTPSRKPTPTPTPTPPSSGGHIPDTGQDNWPVPVLAFGGLLIFALGWSMRYNGRNSKDET